MGRNLILAIDPGPQQSAYVLYDPVGKTAEFFGKVDNDAILDIVSSRSVFCTMAIEQIECFGKPVGAEVFSTVFWSGRFWQSSVEVHWDSVLRRMIPRRAVKMHLCGAVAGVTDAVIRQRLIDLFGPGKDVAIGRKAAPGPLYGIKADAWQALALAVTCAETKE